MKETLARTRTSTRSPSTGTCLALARYGPKGKEHAVAYMSGNGGNKIVLVPDLDLVAVLTSTNYGTKGMHEQTDRLLGDYVDRGRVCARGALRTPQALVTPTGHDTPVPPMPQ